MISAVTAVLRRVSSEKNYLNNLKIAILLLGFVIVLPYALNVVLGYDSLAASILIWGLIATAYNLLHGYSGLLSFGHAAFIGMSMYLTAILMRAFNTTVAFDLFLLSAIVAVALTTLFAYSIGRLISEKGAIYFAMLTLAFAQIVWYLARIDPAGLTGGQNGLIRGILPEWLQSDLGNLIVVLGGVSIDYYWIVSVVFIISLLTIYTVIRSPMGRTLTAIRQNEELARSIGVDIRKYKVVSFSISALFSAVAGVLLLIYEGGVGTTILSWETSGDIVIITVLGGISHFFGPLIGAIFWEGGSAYLSSFSVIHIPLTSLSYDVSHLVQYWTVLFGIVFVIVVLIKPVGGLYQIGHDAVIKLLSLFRKVIGTQAVSDKDADYNE
jgi:branched-chain amino acid transport system permease protein